MEAFGKGIYSPTTTREMESKDKKVELLQIAIKQLIEEDKFKNVKRSSSDESFADVCSDEDVDHDHRLLSKLLSQLETLKDNGILEELEQPSSTDVRKADLPEVGEKSETANNEAHNSGSELGKEEIIGELKKLKRQNFITHCLLSAMIVLTVAWQLSEVSLILKIKEGLSNPLKSFGSLIKGLIKDPTLTVQEVDKLTSAKQNPLLTASSLPCLKIPELPRVELPVFYLDSEDE